VLPCRYKFTCLDKTGRKIHGGLEAADRDSALKILAGRNYLVTELTDRADSPWGLFSDTRAMQVLGLMVALILTLVSARIYFLGRQNLRTSAGFFLLRSAINLEDAAQVRILLKKYPRIVDCRGEDDWRPIHYAVLSGSREIAGLLLQAGAQVNAGNNFKLTPLHMAIYREDLPMASFLLDEKAEVNAPDKLGNTPLHYAAMKDSAGAVELLMNHEANPGLKNDDGETPIAEARARRADSLVEMMTR